MSLAFGRHFLSIPGPSVMPDRVLNAMHRDAPNIYEGALAEMVSGLYEDLLRVARTREGRVAVYAANGHGAWEAAISNLFSRGDKAVALDCGRFAEGWAMTARQMGVDCQVVSTGERGPVPPETVEALLRADVNHEIKAVIVVQVDTASSARNDIPAIRKAIDAAGHPALFLVDCIASLGTETFEFDAWGVDVMVAGSQKGLMTPPGLSFAFVGPRAWEVRGDLVTAYWDWRPRAAPEMFYQRFGGTAPTHLLFGLRQAATMLLEEEGIEAAWRRQRILADATRAAVEAWGENGGPVELNVQDEAARANAVTTILTRGFPPAALRKLCEDQMGVTLGIGLGRYAGTSFRIGHMGWLNPPMILGTLGAVETAFNVMGVSHGAGVAAAAETIARGLSEA
ncbi:alanine-glyoxylate transaminase / serine-glyoxylate transaminase / serine-pyruvate transaminase [Albimonas donghaensis]|uniref:Alanine-glyoxylate transaminase / serine-glyoxylate transaminase / serine-pyruvate transaminase n=1 Tax=Albimonas donghaensis TaxID=356660 RepID=A0A1H2RGQ6_9RHOB|nr:aminotransferase class V-fold PLP-dependent enzyme [Albimonas donghaensis]SDW18567.1 alanine-glyoxylate transaminase / serine-glyoxylate transaminase / serine-pyruvate transaminase [Albimonas donghaensis]